MPYKVNEWLTHCNSLNACMNDRMNKELNKINEMKVVKNIIEEKQTEVEDLLP